MVRDRAALLWALLAALGCRPGTPTDVDFGALPEPDALLETLRRQGERRRSLRATGRVTAFGPEGRVRLRTVIVAQRPRSFRLETLTPFEQPVDVMASDGERLWLLREGELFEGPASAENVARLLPLPMAPEELVETLLGGVPVPAGFSAVRVEAAGDRWRLHLEGAAGSSGVLELDPKTLRVLSAAHRDPSGELRTEVDFAGYRAAPDGGPAVPTEIEVRVPSIESELSIRLGEPELDVELLPSLFSLPHGSSRPFAKTN